MFRCIEQSLHFILFNTFHLFVLHNEFQCVDNDCNAMQIFLAMYAMYISQSRMKHCSLSTGVRFAALKFAGGLAGAKDVHR